jgi:hypothetical protein
MPLPLPIFSMSFAHHVQFIASFSQCSKMRFFSLYSMGWQSAKSFLCGPFAGGINRIVSRVWDAGSCFLLLECLYNIIRCFSVVAVPWVWSVACLLLYCVWKVWLFGTGSSSLLSLRWPGTTGFNENTDYLLCFWSFGWRLLCVFLTWGGLLSGMRQLKLNLSCFSLFKTSWGLLLLLHMQVGTHVSCLFYGWFPCLLYSASFHCCTPAPSFVFKSK